MAFSQHIIGNVKTFLIEIGQPCHIDVTMLEDSDDVSLYEQVIDKLRPYMNATYTDEEEFISCGSLEYLPNIPEETVFEILQNLKITVFLR